MTKKLLLAAAVVVGSVAFAQTSQAGDCYRGYRHGYGASHHYRYGYARRPVVSVAVPRYGAYRPPTYGYPGVYPGSLYRSYSPYRSPYLGPGAGFGYGSFGPYYRGSGIGIGFGF